jgi:nucleoid-associated protein YgaU
VPTTALGDPSNETIHVVQSGETYWSIARQHYSAGRYFKALVEYNKPRIADARALKPGMKVLIPDAEVLDAKFASHIPSGAPAKKQPGGLFFDSAGQPFYRVGPSDSLGGIAQRHLGRSSRSQEIFELNQDVLASPHKLKLGTILKMPENASQVEAAASLPVNR